MRPPLCQCPAMGEPTLPDRARLRVFLFLPWADGVEDAAAFIGRIPAVDLRGRVSDPDDGRLLRMARLDLDWHGETARCFAALAHPGIEFLPALVVGPPGLSDLLGRSAARPPGERWCLAFTGQHPQSVGAVVGRLCAALRSRGVGVLYYAFDEASRTMKCFDELAPHLDILIHDELPLCGSGAARLRPGCLSLHRSWVANVIPFASPFVEAPEEKIVFLGSELGLTPHRKRQVEFLRSAYGDRLVAIHDHSLAVAGRASLGRYKVALCPEGRMFSTPAMSRTHTDRPFWSGCLGMVPVSEDSREGNRLEELAAADLLVRYPHGDLQALARACEAALAAGAAGRRRIYEHYNRFETVGRVAADSLATAVLGNAKVSWPP
jgi:hypothetical protein